MRNSAFDFLMRLAAAALFITSACDVKVIDVVNVTGGAGTGPCVDSGSPSAGSCSPDASGAVGSSVVSVGVGGFGGVGGVGGGVGGHGGVGGYDGVGGFGGFDGVGGAGGGFDGVGGGDVGGGGGWTPVPNCDSHVYCGGEENGCYCEAPCNGHFLSFTCEFNSEDVLECECVVDRAVVGTCEEPGQLCRLSLGCCARTFLR
ncbi:hypothetical protein WMF20_39705 [Sorangium sp. So ce834]|uniref:hypothetical protein n=1 Tax=Sorangium sp. So ce834 TaxID=3133321 RepID=UPI003F5F2576